jgi:hypothetical protein
MVNGIPLFANVGVDMNEATLLWLLGWPSRLTGSEAEYAGLSVRRLWIRGFFCARVPTDETNVVCELLLPDLAALKGVVTTADDEDGR